jgi:hypothetical protein
MMVLANGGSFKKELIVPQLADNNVLFYYGPLLALGGQNDPTVAAAVMSRFDFVVIQIPTGTDIPVVQSILQAYQVMNPRGKAFGYTDLGGTSLAAWQAQVDAWTAVAQVTNTSATTGTGTTTPVIATPPVVTGIYIDNFGFDNAPTVTRDVQNQVINYLHTGSLTGAAPAAGTTVVTYAAMVSPTVIFDAFDLIGTQPAAVFGTSAVIRDYLVLDNFFFNNTNTLGTLTSETVEHRTGRLRYAKDVVATRILGNTGAYNVGFLALMGAGNNPAVLEADWVTAIGLANTNRLEGFGVAPHDKGLTTNRYFEKFTANQFL